MQNLSFAAKGVTIESLNKLAPNTLVEALGIEFTHVGDTTLTATMPVDHRTHQPLGLLHGGASVSLAETLGSVAATLCLDMKTQYCVGLEINANHIKSARAGFVTGIVSPIHIGKRTHIWQTRITNEQGELICISRITVAIIDKR
jgi:1,4-dihydroxy-2-naphthoyl-CoA hydrolase